MQSEESELEEAPTKVTVNTGVKRGPGRPRKLVALTPASTRAGGKGEKERGRGRPLKQSSPPPERTPRAQRISRGQQQSSEEEGVEKDEEPGEEEERVRGESGQQGGGVVMSMGEEETYLGLQAHLRSEISVRRKWHKVEVRAK